MTTVLDKNAERTNAETAGAPDARRAADAFGAILASARSGAREAFVSSIASILADRFSTPVASAVIDFGDECLERGAGAAETGGAGGDDAAWRRALSTELLECQATGRSLARAYGRGSQGGDATCALAAAPVPGPSGTAVGAIGVVASCASTIELESIALELRMLAAQVAEAVRARRTAPRSEGNEADLAGVFARAGGYRTLGHFAFDIANRLAPRTGCEQVSVGWARNGAVRLQAISGMDRLNRRSPGAHRITQAMEECLDAGEPIVSQSGDAWAGCAVATHHRIHEQWRAEFGGAAVASVPILAGDECVAVVSLRRPVDQPFTPDDVDLISRLVSPLAGAIPLVEQSTRPPLRRLGHAARRWAKALVAPEGRPRRLLLAAALVPAAWVLLGAHEFRITVPAIVAADEIAHASAPFDGRIAEVLVEPGARVGEGDPVVRMDTTELELERAALVAEARSLAIEVQQLTAAGDEAAAATANARRALASTRLAALEARIGRSVVRATRAGVVLGPSIAQRVGEVVRLGAPLVTVAAGEGSRLELLVPERLVTDLATGAEVVFLTNADPESARSTTLGAVAPAVEVRDGAPVFVAEAPLRAGDHDLRPGMEGVARVSAGDRPVWWLMFRRAIDYAHLEFAGR